MPLTKFDLRQTWNWGGLSFRGLVVRTWKALDRHDTLNQAAVVAFYGMLALVPLLGLVLAFAIAGRGGVAGEVLDLSARFLPPAADAIVRNQVAKIQTAPPVTLLSVSAVLLLWSASSLFVAVMDTINVAYGVKDERPWWKRRLVALLLTSVEVVLLLGASILAVVWPMVLDHVNLGEFEKWLTLIAQWVIVLVMLLGAFELAYYFGPYVDQRWEWITPGAVIGVLLLIAASLGFRLYLRFGDTYSETYGAMAGVIVMMLWMYLAALALLLGAEVNCVIGRAHPEGKTPGKATPIEKEDPVVPVAAAREEGSASSGS